MFKILVSLTRGGVHHTRSGTAEDALSLAAATVNLANVISLGGVRPFSKESKEIVVLTRQFADGAGERTTFSVAGVEIEVTR